MVYRLNYELSLHILISNGSSIVFVEGASGIGGVSFNS